MEWYLNVLAEIFWETLAHPIALYYCSLTLSNAIKRHYWTLDYPLMLVYNTASYRDNSDVPKFSHENNFPDL